MTKPKTNLRKLTRASYAPRPRPECCRLHREADVVPTVNEYLYKTAILPTEYLNKTAIQLTEYLNKISIRATST